MKDRLSDEDVDRIARAVIRRLILLVLALAAGAYLVPIIALGALGYVGRATGGVPWLAVPLMTAVLAGPLIVLIWFWGRSRRVR
jgi:hypothetical protein